MLKRKTADDYHALAQQRGYTWLGPQVSDVRTKTGWQCDAGHIWQATYTSLQRGHGCLQCVYDRRRKQPEDYHALAQQRGFTWLGPEVEGSSHIGFVVD